MMVSHMMPNEFYHKLSLKQTDIKVPLCYHHDSHMMPNEFYHKLSLKQTDIKLPLCYQHDDGQSYDAE